MRVDLFGLTMDTPGTTFYLWSPWRCSALEHKLFESLRTIPNASLEAAADEVRIHITDAKGWKAAVQNLSRVLKGWQEEATDGGKEERRGWRWLLEADVDGAGYDMQGEKSSFWAYLRLSLDRGGVGEAEKGEDIDLNGFGVQVWGQQE
ncbi:MAG: hypothetical protein C0467_27425 [Planctomycetaceae bacterium]|nr:hypothetical protein [Planctomycetaceae bacterium]